MMFSARNTQVDIKEYGYGPKLRKGAAKHDVDARRGVPPLQRCSTVGPTGLMLTPHTASNIKAAPTLLERAGRLRYLLGDKGYDAHSIRR